MSGLSAVHYIRLAATRSEWFSSNALVVAANRVYGGLAILMHSFITSRPADLLPTSAAAMQDHPWYNPWQKRLAPYYDLQRGDLLYWYNSTTQKIEWSSRVSVVEKFPFSNKRVAKDRLFGFFNDKDDFQDYFDKAPESGFCLAFKIEQVAKIAISKPAGENFSRNGWLRSGDAHARTWFDTIGNSAAIEDLSDAYIPNGEDRRESINKEVPCRPGAPVFRQSLINRYGANCMISGCGVLKVVEAAHIYPYNGDVDDHEQNGLILRADLHLLFDAFLLGIDPDTFTIHIDPSLLATEYASIAGQKLRANEKVPSSAALRIRWRWYLDFKGKQK